MSCQPKDIPGAQAAKGEFVHKDLEEAGEERGFGGQCPDHSSPQPGASFGKEHEAGHQTGFAAQFAMGARVRPEIAGLDRLHQGVSLVKTQGQTFAGDGVKRT